MPPSIYDKKSGKKLQDIETPTPLVQQPTPTAVPGYSPSGFGGMDSVIRNNYAESRGAAEAAEINQAYRDRAVRDQAIAINKINDPAYLDPRVQRQMAAQQERRSMGVYGSAIQRRQQGGAPYQPTQAELGVYGDAIRRRQGEGVSLPPMGDPAKAQQDLERNRDLDFITGGGPLDDNERAQKQADREARRQKFNADHGLAPGDKGYKPSLEERKKAKEAKKAESDRLRSEARNRQRQRAGLPPTEEYRQRKAAEEQAKIRAEQDEAARIAAEKAEGQRLRKENSQARYSYISGLGTDMAEIDADRKELQADIDRFQRGRDALKPDVDPEKQRAKETAKHDAEITRLEDTRKREEDHAKQLNRQWDRLQAKLDDPDFAGPYTDDEGKPMREQNIAGKKRWDATVAEMEKLAKKAQEIFDRLPEYDKKIQDLTVSKAGVAKKGDAEDKEYNAKVAEYDKQIADAQKKMDEYNAKHGELSREHGRATREDKDITERYKLNKDDPDYIDESDRSPWQAPQQEQQGFVFDVMRPDGTPAQITGDDIERKADELGMSVLELLAKLGIL